MLYDAEMSALSLAEFPWDWCIEKELGITYNENKSIHLAQVHKRVRLFVRLCANAIKVL